MRVVTFSILMLAALSGCNALLGNEEGELVVSSGGAGGGATGGAAGSVTGGTGGGGTGGAATGGGGTGGAGTGGGGSGGGGTGGSATGGAGGAGACAVELDLGDHHACARKGDGTLWCWGMNNYGQIGDGGTADKKAPAQVQALGTAVAELATGGYHTCARKGDGSAWCWGLNDFGQLGDGTSVKKTAPAAVKDLGAVANLTAGTMHSCARKADGTAWCWGLNDAGQIGDGTLVNKPTPVQVKALGTVAQLAAGGAHTCARKTDATLWCWGNNDHGQIGPGGGSLSSGPVELTALGTETAEVTAGAAHTCVRKTNGTVWCWGDNAFGQLGDGSSTASAAPVPVTALGASVVEVSAGASHTCARKQDGTLWCWGDNNFGQLGDGTYDKKTSPAQVTSLGTTVAEAEPGYGTSCARKADGTVWCWGLSSALGDGTPGSEVCGSQKCTPAPVKTLLCP